MPAGDVRVRLLLVPLSAMPLLADQFVVAGFEFCCKVQPHKDDGHNTMTLLAERLMIRLGGGKVEVLINTERVLEPEFALIKSGRPSPFTSAAVTEYGPGPTEQVAAVAKLPFPTLINTESVLSP